MGAVKRSLHALRIVDVDLHDLCAQHLELFRLVGSGIPRQGADPVTAAHILQNGATQASPLRPGSTNDRDDFLFVHGNPPLCPPFVLPAVASLTDFHLTLTYSIGPDP
jgi:hypothetical protein